MISLQAVGDYLREQRLARGWTLQKLADKCGCRRQFIHSVEKGEVKPGKEKLRALAKALGRDGLVLRLLAGDVPEEVIEALVEHPEQMSFILDNHNRRDLSHLSEKFSRPVN